MLNPSENYRTSFSKIALLFISSVAWTLLLSACSAVPAPQTATDMNTALTQAVATILSGGTQTAEFLPPTSINTETPIPQPTAIRTPPALPDSFKTSLLNSLDIPHQYIQDTCQVLNAKWDTKNAVPGTVVMPIMFHGIAKGDTNPGNTGAYHDMSMKDFNRLMNDLKKQGFEAISMQQMADFMNNNAKIPQRSVLLIVDDRKYRQSFDDTFFKYYQDWGWTVVNSYITLDERPDLWAENAALEAEGWVDHQAHGYVHNVNITSASSEDFIRQELGKPFEMLKKYFNKTPIAYIWPGGSFTKRAVEIAREYKYQLGFTVNPRGPVMYNWVPLADANDPARPSYIPEGDASDPLLTLPRYWSPDARNYIDSVRNISDEAAAFAEKNKAVEMRYYDIMCAPTYGAFP